LIEETLFATTGERCAAIKAHAIREWRAWVPFQRHGLRPPI